MNPFTHRRTGLALITVVCASLSASLLGAVPASASPSDAPAIVQRAEHALGLQDDDVTDAVRVLDPGTVETIPASADAPAVPVVVNPDNRPGASYTADRLADDSIRFAAGFSSRTASTASWKLAEGSELDALPDGRVSVGDADGNLLAGIDAPWAVDATGQRVPTHYTVSGTTLTQHLDYTPNTVFPVVADPKITSFPGYWTVKFTRSESMTVTSTVAACAAFFSKSPVPALKALTIGCAVFAAYGTPQLANGKCLSVHILGAPPVFATWWPTWPKC